MTRPLSQGLARFAIGGAVVALAASLAAHHPDGATATESGFLALLCGLVLGALALGPRSTAPTVIGGTLVAVALFLPAAEGTRGALIGLLLVAAVSWASWRALTAEQGPAWLDAAAVTLAWQTLLRCERLLDLTWTPRTLAWLLVLPLAVALALWWSARRGDGAPPLVLLAALAGLGPGWTGLAAAVLTIVVAIGDERPSWPAAGLAAAASAAAIWWQPPAAVPLLILVAALSWRRHAVARWLPALGALVWVGLGGASEPPLGGLAWLLASVPLALLARRASLPLLAAALALALTPAAAAPALALAALALPAQAPWRRLQEGWSLALLAAIALAAAYPWLRSSPVVPSVGASPQVLTLAAVAVLVAGLLALASARGARLPSWSTPLAVGALLAAGLLTTQPPAVVSEPVILARGRPSLQVPLPTGAVGTLVIDSFVSGGEGLAAGREVARIRFIGGDGRRQDLALRLGRQTADWAARRLVGPSATPPVWLTWLAADGTPAQRYRTRFVLDPPIAARGIEIRRRGNLPPKVELAILSVSLR